LQESENDVMKELSALAEIKTVKMKTKYEKEVTLEI
jgi:hypothetical protein